MNCIENEKGNETASSLVSVVVPVYNVEKYLYRCVDSIRNQTYRNLEIILVDDGSPDQSGVLCDEIAKNDKRVRVIHKKNGGLSSARNAGMAASTGVYLGFVDSDDWIAQDMYEYLVKLLEKSNAEIAQINCKKVTEFVTEQGSEEEQIKVLKNKEILQNYMITTTATGSYSVWRCLFKRKLLEGLFFREGKINEDIDFKYKALQRCGVYAESNLKKYFYFQSVGSTTTSGLKNRDFDLYDAAVELCRLTEKETYGTIRFLGEVKARRTAFSLLCRIAYYGIADPDLDRKEIIKKLTKEHRRNLPVLLKAPLPWSRKILAVLLALHIDIAKIFVDMAKRVGII
ncbi:MAG: glycosyltransferase [Lachnospiraceae bacterium]|nr:glycosyltransferase [Lachnospiraceae bacterium]